MQVNKVILRGAYLTLRGRYNNESSRLLHPAFTSTNSVQQIGRAVRELHTVILKSGPAGRSSSSPGIRRSLLTTEWQNNSRTAGFLVLARCESSSVTKIPPLTSEVFSREDVGPGSGSSVASNNATDVAAASSQSASRSSSGVSENTVNSSSSSPGEVVPSEATSAASTTTTQDAQLIWESVPEPPAIPNPVDELSTHILNAAGEAPFTSLGLGGWSPSGIVQQCLEFFHVGIGLPWWGSILLGTLCVRLLVFPLVIKSQRNAAKMQNNMPQMQAIQLKMTEARQSGNSLMAAKYGQEMMTFMKEKDISPFKSVLVPIAMAPIFISFFFGLRKMANLPVDSMKEGGLWWFMDLTVADPYCLLPLLTSVTLWVTMEVGVDGVQLNSSNHGQLMRYFMRAIPVIMFPFTMNFPAAILCYWVSTNAVSLVQVSMLKIPKVRASLNIEPLRKFNPDALPIKKKGFVDSFKDSWTNVKISKEMEDRHRYDEISFRRAGKGPIPKTYKYDPTKGAPERATAPIAVQAKQKR